MKLVWTMNGGITNEPFIDFHSDLIQNALWNQSEKWDRFFCISGSRKPCMPCLVSRKSGFSNTTSWYFQILFEMSQSSEFCLIFTSYFEVSSLIASMKFSIHSNSDGINNLFSLSYENFDGEDSLSRYGITLLYSDHFPSWSFCAENLGYLFVYFKRFFRSVL